MPVHGVAVTGFAGARVCPVALVRHVPQSRLRVVAVDGTQSRGTGRNGAPAWRSARPWGLNEDTNA